MMMETASDGFPVCKIITIKQNSKVRQANDTQNVTALNILTQPKGAEKHFKFHFSNNVFSDEQRLCENCIYGG